MSLDKLRLDLRPTAVIRLEVLRLRYEDMFALAVFDPREPEGVLAGPDVPPDPRRAVPDLLPLPEAGSPQISTSRVDEVAMHGF